jgi:hypothetical protein
MFEILKMKKVFLEFYKNYGRRGRHGYSEKRKR